MVELGGVFLCFCVLVHKATLMLNPEASRVLATGGASRNAALLQVMADVFTAPVYTMVGGTCECVGEGGQ